MASANEHTGNGDTCSTSSESETEESVTKVSETIRNFSISDVDIDSESDFECALPEKALAGVSEEEKRFLRGFFLTGPHCAFERALLRNKFVATSTPNASPKRRVNIRCIGCIGRCVACCMELPLDGVTGINQERFSKEYFAYVCASDESRKQARTRSIIDLADAMGYNLIQINGQRIYGNPPPEWVGPKPPRGSEVFVGNLPHDCYEDELVPMFATIGTLYELRLMMQFSGHTRGYAFVTYETPDMALRAVTTFNESWIRCGSKIGVMISTNNCRLYIGNIEDMETEVFIEQVCRTTEQVHMVNVYHYKRSNSPTAPLYLEGYRVDFCTRYAVIEYDSHKDAAMAKRNLSPIAAGLWGSKVTVEWDANKQNSYNAMILSGIWVRGRGVIMTKTGEYLQQQIPTEIIDDNKSRKTNWKTFPIPQLSESYIPITNDIGMYKASIITHEPAIITTSTTTFTSQTSTETSSQPKTPTYVLRPSVRNANPSVDLLKTSASKNQPIIGLLQTVPNAKPILVSNTQSSAGLVKTTIPMNYHRYRSSPSSVNLIQPSIPHFIPSIGSPTFKTPPLSVFKKINQTAEGRNKMKLSALPFQPSETYKQPSICNEQFGSSEQTGNQSMTRSFQPSISTEQIRSSSDIYQPSLNTNTFRPSIYSEVFKPSTNTFQPSVSNGQFSSTTRTLTETLPNIEQFGSSTYHQPAFNTEQYGTQSSSNKEQLPGSSNTNTAPGYNPDPFGQLTSSFPPLVTNVPFIPSNYNAPPIAYKEYNIFGGGPIYNPTLGEFVWDNGSNTSGYSSNSDSSRYKPKNDENKTANDISTPANSMNKPSDNQNNQNYGEKIKNTFKPRVYAPRCFSYNEHMPVEYCSNYLTGKNGVFTSSSQMEVDTSVTANYQQYFAPEVEEITSPTVRPPPGFSNITRTPSESTYSYPETTTSVYSDYTDITNTDYEDNIRNAYANYQASTRNPYTGYQNNTTRNSYTNYQDNIRNYGNTNNTGTTFMDYLSGKTNIYPESGNNASIYGNAGYTVDNPGFPDTIPGHNKMFGNTIYPDNSIYGNNINLASIDNTIYGNNDVNISSKDNKVFSNSGLTAFLDNNIYNPDNTDTDYQDIRTVNYQNYPDYKTHDYNNDRGNCLTRTNVTETENDNNYSYYKWFQKFEN